MLASEHCIIHVCFRICMPAWSVSTHSGTKRWHANQLLCAPPWGLCAAFHPFWTAGNMLDLRLYVDIFGGGVAGCRQLLTHRIIIEEGACPQALRFCRTCLAACSSWTFKPLALLRAGSQLPAGSSSREAGALRRSKLEWHARPVAGIRPF